MTPTATPTAFTHAVELIRFALYRDFNGLALLWVLLAGAVFMALALWGYDPARGLIRRKATTPPARRSPTRCSRARCNSASWGITP